MTNPNYLRIRRVCPKYDIRHEVDTPVVNHLILLEGNFEIIPTEQSPILGYKTESYLLRLSGFVRKKNKEEEK